MLKRFISTSVSRLATEAPVGAPTTAASLGFTKRENRTRKLDDSLGLAVPRNTGKIVSSLYQSRMQRAVKDKVYDSRIQRPDGSPGPSSGPARDRTPRGDRPPRSPRAEPSSDEFFAAGSTEAKPRTRTRKSNVPRGTVDMSTPNVNFKAARSISKSIKRAAKPTMVARPVDNSPAGMFGRVSLLTPVRRGARDLSATLGAEGVEQAEARRQEVRRLAGDYSLFAANASLPASNPALAAQSLALRVLSQNAQVSLRSQREAKGVLETLIR